MGARRYLPSDWTRKQVITDYLLFTGRRELSPATRDFYGLVLDWLSYWLEAHHGTTLEKATPEQLGAWRAQLTVAPRSVVSYMAAVRSFYRWAFRMRLVDDPDPTWAIPIPRYRRGVPRPIAEDLYWYAIDHAPARVRPWLVLAGGEGARCYEIANLQRSDIMETARPQPMLRLPGKGNKPRMVPLSPWVWGELQAVGLPKRGPVFPRLDGKPGPNAPHVISQASSAYFKSIDVAATLHMCRHRFATVALNACGGNLRVVQELLGHSDPSTTGIYTAFANQEAIAAVLGTQPPTIRPVRAIGDELDDTAPYEPET